MQFQRILRSVLWTARQAELEFTVLITVRDGINATISAGSAFIALLFRPGAEHAAT